MLTFAAPPLPVPAPKRARSLMSRSDAPRQRAPKEVESRSVVSDGPSQSTSETASWSNAEVQTALMQCLQAVAPIAADLAPVTPFRDGECGTPAPVLLSSVGSPDKVAFDPPLFLNCPMVVALHGWLKDVVQPAAKEAFGLPVAK